MKTNQFNPEQEAVLTYQPAFQDQPFTVTGIGEALLPIIESVQALPQVETNKVSTQPEKPVLDPSVAVYVDFSALPTRIVARKRLKARVYDMFHRTNMYGALVERIEDDRDVHFARDLGILGVTRCQKHEKAVSKLRGLVN